MDIYEKLLQHKEIHSVNYHRNGVLINEQFFVKNFWLKTDRWIADIVEEVKKKYNNGRGNINGFQIRQCRN